jgi:hydrogenase-4 component F
MILALIMIPFVAAVAAAAIPSNRLRPWVLPIAAVAHIVAAMFAIWGGTSATPTRWLALDPAGKIVLLLISILFLMCSFYTVGYLREHPEQANRIFCMCLLLFLATGSLVVMSRHLGLLWVAIEGTTLATAPLIYFNRKQTSIEATWKYLLICSVGIALALLGSFFLAYALLQQGLPSSLLFDDLIAAAQHMSKPWLHAAFVMLIVGYGTKMGLAPMHTWLPDAHSEAPTPVSAILSGALLPCAFLAILRVYAICATAGDGVFARRIMLVLGLFSMAVAAVFMIGQRDFKRMLAYSSVEHMGIIVLGLGVGATFGAMFHVINNGLTKGVLFLSAGNIQRAYGSKSVDQVRGAIRRLPLSGLLFLLGIIAITGSPPFSPFVSEFMILNGAFASRQFAGGALFLILLMAIFLGMGRTVLTVVQGRPPAAARKTAYRDGWLSGLPVLVSLLIVLLLGLYIPSPLRNLLGEAVRSLEVTP